jgi:hypothetical protein
MAARTTWLLLWPVLVVVGLFDFTVLALTCGDTGLATYGDPDAMRFCARIRDQEADFLLIGFIPLAVLAVGALLWPWPSALSIVNVAAFIAGGVMSASLTLVASATVLALLLSFAWWLVLVVAIAINAEARTSEAREAADAGMLTAEPQAQRQRSGRLHGFLRGHRPR